MENLHFAAKMLWKNAIADVSALGGLPFYSIATIYFVLAGYAMALKLTMALAIFFAAVYSIKLIYFRARPDVAKRRFATLAERLESSSFPSVHAGRAVLLYIALFHGTALELFGMALALAVCASRVLLQRHYFSDVVAGSLLGIIVGYYVFVV